ncbi:class I SAM-dependent methyltransferase [Rubricoccus marinus]|uniref:Methyltransferase type 11 n=1 Tax=Rubricoccus marinus TaxID=716817 RepID=A0A259U2U0_9BACT|nr:class I SAM-dependent methyltransferase [Rubricoccus marinus]OZC04148.1 methyltransferase type 11 [Rubricoccus marinus]
MDYDPVKDRLGAFFWKTPTRTKAFFRTLDAVFLRSWYVRRALREIIGASDRQRPFRVLDAGTGFGQYAYWLVKTFPHVEVLAVDVKQDYLDRARAFLDTTPYASRVTFEQRDLTEPMAEEDAFDLCLSVDVMEHIEDDRAVFRNFHRVLASGGHVIVNTPSDQGGSGVTEEGDESWIGEHVRDGYNAGELREKLETAGLEHVRTEYGYGPWGTVGWRLLVKWPIAALNTTWAAAPLLAPYYALAGPAGLALNRADLARDNASGTGLTVVSRKP